MFRPSNDIALVFFEKCVLSKVELCCLKATVPSYSIPLTKFLWGVLDKHKQNYLLFCNNYPESTT